MDLETLNALTIAGRIADRLDEDELPYAIGGALALGVWGAPRATKDVDLSIFIREAELARAFEALERAGVMIDRDAAAKSVARIGLFKGRAGKIFVDAFISGHPQYDAMQARRASVEDPSTGKHLWFISAEDLCIHKLVFGRPKDVTDLERLFAVRAELDVAYVRAWLTQMVPAGDPRGAILDDLVRRFRPA